VDCSGDTVAAVQGRFV